MQKEMDYRRKECASSKVSTTKTAATEVMTRMASRVLSVFLTLSMALVMVLEALPALEAKAATEGGEWPNSIGTVVHISSASELKEYLSKLEDYTIVLDKDIDYHEDGEYQYWCTTAGAKVLDLNGHDIWISNDNQMTSTLFRIPVGCELILNDNAHSSDKEDVNILYNARVHSYDEVIYRNTFEVRGTLIQNGGYICAGRSKRKYYAAACEYAYQVMFGDGVQVYGGGLFVMNDGWLRGYGNFRNALYCNGGKAYINNGNVVGEYGAYAVCEGSAPGGKIRISAGTFETHEKDQVAYFWDYAAVDPNAKKKYDTTRFFARELDGTYVYGNYMLQKGEYDEGWKSYRDYYMTVAPKSGDACGFTVPNGEKCKASDSNSVFYLMDADKATLSVEKNNEYFQGIPENRANICGHVVNYLWRLYSGSEELASIVTQNNTINFAKDFNKSGFSVKTGRVYRVECQVVESLLDKVSFFHEKKSIDVALCLPEGSVEVNLDNFPDPYFMLYVHMMLDPNHDYILTSEELNAVTELNVGAGVNYEFTSLEGAQNFPYLQAIYAKGNPNLRSIDLGDMPFLMELDLEGCSIDSLNVSGCPNLRVLKLGKICDYSNTNGELTTLNITNCPLLEKLEIYQSKLQNIDISRCPLLVEAVLYGTEEEQYSLGFIEKKYAKTDAYVRTTYNNQQFFYVAKLDRDIPNSYLRSAVKSAYGVNDDN